MKSCSGSIKAEELLYRSGQTDNSIHSEEPVMDAILQLLAAALISIFVSSGVLRVLSGPLRKVLCRICPDEAAADFWLSYSKVMLMIVPLLLVLLVDMFGNFASALDGVRFALSAALAGLIVSLRLIGLRLEKFVRWPASESAS